MLRIVKSILSALIIVTFATIAVAQQSPLDAVVPKVEFEQVPLQNAVAYLLGDYKIDFDIDPRLASLPVTINRTNQTLRNILREFAQQVGAEVVYDEKTNTVQFRVRPFERVPFNFLNVYDGVLLFGGSIISPIQGAMLALSSGGLGFGGLGGWGGLGGGGGGWGGLGGWGGGLGGGLGGIGRGGWGGGTLGSGRRTRGGARRGGGGFGF